MQLCQLRASEEKKGNMPLIKPSVLVNVLIAEKALLRGIASVMWVAGINTASKHLLPVCTTSPLGEFVVKAVPAKILYYGEGPSHRVEVALC